MYCGQQRPLSEFRRRTGKRAGPGARRGACRRCRQRSGQADVSDIPVQQGQSLHMRMQRQEKITNESSAAANQRVIQETADEGSEKPHSQAEPLSSASSEPSGDRKKRRRRRKSKRQQVQPDLEHSERITESSASGQAERDPKVGGRTISNVRAEQAAAQPAVAASEASLPEDPQDPAAEQQLRVSRPQRAQRKRRRKRSAPPGAGTGPDRIAVKCQQ